MDVTIIDNRILQGEGLKNFRFCPYRYDNLLIYDYIHGVIGPELTVVPSNLY